jgi:hypothetical protein
MVADKHSGRALLRTRDSKPSRAARPACPRRESSRRMRPAKPLVCRGERDARSSRAPCGYFHSSTGRTSASSTRSIATGSSGAGKPTLKATPSRSRRRRSPAPTGPHRHRLRRWNGPHSGPGDQGGTGSLADLDRAAGHLRKRHPRAESLPRRSWCDRARGGANVAKLTECLRFIRVGLSGSWRALRFLQEVSDRSGDELAL